MRYLGIVACHGTCPSIHGITRAFSYLPWQQAFSRQINFARSSKLQWLVVLLWFVVKVKSLSTSVAAMSEPSHENSPDSRSVNSSCSTDSNTDESPVTQKDSSRRVRRGPVRLERLVDRQRRANTFYRRKENLMKKVSNLVTYPTSCWNIFLTCNESSFDCEGI